MTTEKRRTVSVVATPPPTPPPLLEEYEFGGPVGVTLLTVGLPLLCYFALFACNDVSGCPVPSLLHPTRLRWGQLKRDVGWPKDGLAGLTSVSAMAWTLGYYGLSVLMQLVLPAEEVEGAELQTGGKLKYRLNAMTSAIIVLTAALVGTITEGANYGLWTYIWANQVQLMTANLMIAVGLATWAYVHSFSIRAGNAQRRELVAGACSGNMVYDWWMGRERNPRLTIPFLGTVDVKMFAEVRPGLLGWLLLDLAFVAHQYRAYGFVSDSILLVAGLQAFYVLDSLWMERAALTTNDITLDGFGFMLAFGDLVWLPFTYSLQARYLAVHPVQLGPARALAILGLQALGYYIFRAANNQKHRFRTQPRDPRTAHLASIRTAAGTRLLVSGWWGRARHINYLGDWLMAWATCLPTGLAGYLLTPVVLSSSTSSSSPLSTPDGSPAAAALVLDRSHARGWAIPFTYFYILFFTVLLVHRQRRDDRKCRRKYGADWDRYVQRVPWRIVPGVY
ncbi:MAG: erg24, C-14 sterol reductase [Phylliscum demangeonii]|nr:MAG: erg24, C-14 sterol reductase [Phylliscum demangeonii]